MRWDIWGMAAAAILSAGTAWGQVEKSPVPPESFVLGPAFWATKTMENEPLMFVKEEGQEAPTAKLMFHATGKLVIRTPDLTTAYVEGKDYVWKPGSNVVELKAGSRIPFKTTAELYPGYGKPNTENGVLFPKGPEAGHYWHFLQVQASYEHEEKWDGAAAMAEPEKLKRSLAKLKARKPIKFVAMGDSITVGGDASGIEIYWAKKVAPYQPGFVRLATNTLAARFGTEITLVNLGVGGTRTGDGLAELDKVIAEKPDVVLIAFGMNDRLKLEDWEANIKKMVETIHAARPDADFILVAPISNNPRFREVDMFKGYVECLRHLEGPQVAVADMFDVWMDMLKRKNYTDLTGNNLNHPNDFVYRVYAQVVMGLYAPSAGEAKGKVEGKKP